MNTFPFLSIYLGKNGVGPPQEIFKVLYKDSDNLAKSALL